MMRWAAPVAVKCMATTDVEETPDTVGVAITPPPARTEAIAED